MATDRVTARTRRAERRREAVREVREELERIRRAEAKVAEALGSARAARQRVEELVRGLAMDDEGVRDIVRQELRAVGDEDLSVPTGDEASLEARPAPGAEEDAGAAGAAEVGDEDDADEVDEPAETRRSYRMVGVTALGVLLVGTAAFFAIRAFNADEEPPTLTVGGDSALPLGGPVAAANGALDTALQVPDSNAIEDSVQAESRFFTLLPEGAPQRAAVYDSLWQAHSPRFTPLFAQIEGATQDDGVKQALNAWKAGSLSALQRDLLHSALVQYSLREEMGAELALDGQLLRNPCRGASCSALLNFWETRGQGYGLPPVPEDAPRNTEALRTAENVLVLRTLETLHRERFTNGR